MSLIRRFKCRIQKIFGFVLLAGGLLSLKFWQHFNFKTLQFKMAKKADKAVGDGTIAVLHCNEVQKQWVGWLERAFSSTKVDDALLFLLLNGIQDKSFINCSIAYGLNLVNFAFQQRAVLNSTLGMVQECLVNEPRVVKQAVELCGWFVNQERAKELSSEIMQKVHLRNDVFDVMTWQLGWGATNSCMTDEWRSATYYGGLGGATDVRFTTEAYN